MPANVTEWDARHREAAQNSPAEPASIVSEWLPLLPHGAALDLACGTGRHALLLAGRGQFVNAVDWSGAALDILESRARKAKIHVSRADDTSGTGSRAHGIRLIQANLDDIQTSRGFVFFDSLPSVLAKISFSANGCCAPARRSARI